MFTKALLVLLSLSVAFAQEVATDPAGGGTALAQASKLKATPAGPTPKASDGKPGSAERAGSVAQHPTDQQRENEKTAMEV